MADLQVQFETFERTIRIDRDGEKALLVEKRQRILNRLSEGISALRSQGIVIPRYEHRNQGSFAMDTGIKPLDDDYDLDVAITFDFTAIARPSPDVVKGWVYESVKNHTASVRWREPCITVFYAEGGESIYHVDLAIYAKDGSMSHLARCREGARPEARSWEHADPAALIDAIRKRFDDSDEQGQFRRVIRSLKRWKDFNFPSTGNEAPRGIALTACAHRWFVPQFDWTLDRVAGRRPNDAHAMLELVGQILSHFDGRGRIQVTLPVPPGNDLFERMSDRQLEVLRAKLQQLLAGLTNANADPDPCTAAQTLAKLFGPDFPVPDPPSTGRKRGPGIVSSGNSG